MELAYVIHYDIAALIITIAMAAFFRYNKTIDTRRNGIFSIIISLAFISNVTDIITIFTATYPHSVPLWMNILLNMIYLVSFNSIPVIYFIYTQISIKGQEEYTKGELLAILFPEMISVLLIVTSPFTKWIFFFDRDGYYCHGAVFDVLYGIAAVYIMGALLLTVRNKRKLSALQQFSVFFYIVGTLICIAIEVNNERMQLISFMVAIVLILIYMTLENPEDYLDKKLGLYNSQAFSEIFSAATRSRKRVTIVGINVEGLKYINETMGASVANVFLADVAKYMKKIDPLVTEFSLGGARLALMGPTEEADWDGIIKKIKDRFKEAFTFNDVEIQLSAAICRLSYPENVSRYQDALDLIDYSIAEARLSSKNEVVYADSEILERGRRETRVIMEMASAISEDKFMVYYQPIYSVERGRVISAEALVRLRSDELGFVPPDEFIQLAEKNGMVVEIGNIVFKKVCEFIATGVPQNIGIEYIHVNLSTVQCMQEKLYKKLIDTMDEYGIRHSMIQFEITETAAVVSKDVLKTNMDNLIKAGVNFAIDDYGTGFSNINTIAEYPFAMIKIDKSLLWRAMKDERAMTALKYSIAMFKELGIMVVCEGVETKEQVDALTKIGCDFLQGYYFSKPIPEGEFINYIEANSQQ